MFLKIVRSACDRRAISVRSAYDRVTTSVRRAYADRAACGMHTMRVRKAYNGISRCAPRGACIAVAAAYNTSRRMSGVMGVVRFSYSHRAHPLRCMVSVSSSYACRDVIVRWSCAGRTLVVHRAYDFEKHYVFWRKTITFSVVFSKLKI